MPIQELNIDGLIGNTHHYGGLSYGNTASSHNRNQVSHPRAAALQGLAKMKVLMDLGIPQAVFPPPLRPDFRFLHDLGFTGLPEQILKTVHTHHPELLMAAYSASSMWAANAATVSPSSDTADKRVHFSPANLISHLHRSLEPPFTTQLLRTLFSDPRYFCVHDPLPLQTTFADEGAANHLRFSIPSHDHLNHPPKTAHSLHLFAYGRSAIDHLRTSHRYPARQTIEASMAIARRHGLKSEQVVFAQQNPVAIDLGVFHNDVISTANESVFFYHEKAFTDTALTIRQLQDHLDNRLCLIQVADSELSLTDSVSCYLFNSQIVTLPKGGMALIAPLETQASQYAQNVIDRIIDFDNPIQKIIFVDCRQSMLNGGGPACLRLRVPLTETELKHCHPGVILDTAKHEALQKWVKKHYRETLSIPELLDPTLLNESQTSLDELTQILDLGSLYDWQRA